MHGVVLCSDWSRDMYPENSGGKFTNLLHHNMNFSREDWSVALTDIVYTPDTWHNVRDGYNDVQIRMKGFNKWVLYLLHCGVGKRPHSKLTGQSIGSHLGGVREQRGIQTHRTHAHVLYTSGLNGWSAHHGDWAINQLTPLFLSNRMIVTISGYLLL